MFSLFKDEHSSYMNKTSSCRIDGCDGPVNPIQSVISFIDLAMTGLVRTANFKQSFCTSSKTS